MDINEIKNMLYKIKKRMYNAFRCRFCLPFCFETMAIDVISVMIKEEYIESG